MKNRTTALVINTRSRKGKRSLPLVKDLLQKAGLEVDFYPITNPEELSPQVKKLVASGIKLLIIGGGDGTVSQIVDHIAHKDVVLGILPLGTANSFCKSLDIPTDLSAAVEIIAKGKVAEIDLGKINNDYFANAVSIGFASSIADEIPHLLKRYLGVLAYGIQCLRSLRHMKPFTAIFENKKEKQKLETYQIVIANGGFYGPAPLVPKSRLESADLSVFTFKDEKPMQILGIWLRSIAGKRFSQQPTDRILIENELTLTAHPVQKVSIDGEIKTKTPVRISIAPKALKVLVPQKSNL